MGDTYPPLWKAHLTKADERWVRVDCDIPKLVKLHFDDEKWGAMVRADSHEVYLYEAMFRVGFSLPFPWVT